MQVTLKQEAEELTSVLEVHVRRDRKGDTQTQVGVLLRAGHSAPPRAEVSLSLKHTKPLGKRGLFWTQEDKVLT